MSLNSTKNGNFKRAIIKHKRVFFKDFIEEVKKAVNSGNYTIQELKNMEKIWRKGDQEIEGLYFEKLQKSKIANNF